jgi:hypothetical protein
MVLTATGYVPIEANTGVEDGNEQSRNDDAEAAFTIQKSELTWP